MESRTEPKIIGGMFALEKIISTSKSCPPPFFKSTDIFLVNARSGISLLTKLISPPNVWLPTYLCDSILKALERHKTIIRFYEVNYDLVVPSLEWLNDVQAGDLVIMIDYFGFPCDSSCITQVKEQGAWVLEDACQALLSEKVGQESDFVLFSPRKFLGVPDGGILVFNSKVDFNDIKLEMLPVGWWLKVVSATILRREFDIYGGDRLWFELFQEVEAKSPIGPFAMSEFSRLLLQNSFDYSIIAQQRIDNYKLLVDRLANISLFPNLSPNIVPLGFPIRVRNRASLRQVLFDHQIYPPIHWLIRNFVPQKYRESHRLAEEIMTLPCDQRYDSQDISRMINIIQGELKL